MASSLAPLGRLLGTLGQLLGPLECFLGTSWLVLGASCANLSSQGPPRPRFWRVWGRSRLGFEEFGGHNLAYFLLRIALCYLMFFRRSRNAFAFTIAVPSSLLVRRSVRSTWNTFEIDVPKNMGFFRDFCSKNASLQKCRHQQNIGFFQSEWLSDVFLCVAFCMDFQAQKPSQNLSKTMPGLFQNRC